MAEKIVFNSTETVNLAKEIASYLPDNRQEAVLLKLLRLDTMLADCRKELHEMQKNEILLEILPIVFHKLKNKLTPIMGYTQILSAKITDERLKERLKKIENNADELTNQIDMLRDYFSNGQPLKEEMNLNDIIRGMESYFSGVRENHKIALELDLDENIPASALCVGQIEMLIIQMVDNAVQAIKVKNSGEGAIHIRTKAGADAFRLSIKDNGVGIAGEDIPKLWTPFFSGFADKTGIGLTICEKIIANHNAACRVVSTPADSSEFNITFKRTSITENENKNNDKNDKQDDTHNKTRRNR
jgi:signal transduction histidine kinase